MPHVGLVTTIRHIEILECSPIAIQPARGSRWTSKFNITETGDSKTSVSEYKDHVTSPENQAFALICFLEINQEKR
jgi:hypothetical protein